jgi:hypothetical protein
VASVYLHGGSRSHPERSRFSGGERDLACRGGDNKQIASLTRILGSLARAMREGAQADRASDFQTVPGLRDSSRRPWRRSGFRLDSLLSYVRLALRQAQCKIQPDLPNSN